MSSFLKTMALEEASRFGLIINTSKTKVVDLTCPIYINGQNVDDVKQLRWVGSIISVDGGTKLNVTRLINTVKFAFAVKLNCSL